MFEHAQWICRLDPALAPWKGRNLPDEEIDAMMGKFPIEEGSVLFAREITLPADVTKATLAVSGLGYYDFYVNGSRPDETRVFAPIYSSYFKMTRYDVYDVTSLLHGGENTLAAEVGPGWFSAPEKWWGWRMMWHGNPRMIAELTVTTADGQTLVFGTDTSWRTVHGKVLKSCIYDGETVDHRIFTENPVLPGTDYSDWSFALAAEAPTEQLLENTAPPTRITRVLKPVSEKRLSDTVILYDFGENTTALPKLVVRGKAGDTVRLNHAEFLAEDGTLDPRSENRAECTDLYTLSGREDTCHPRFTWHGYRYMTVTLSSPDIEILSVESCVIHSDVSVTGTFTCSDEGLNRLHEAFVRTELACLQGVPLDCAQRDERLPWLGDAHATSELCLYNFDMQALYASFLRDMQIGVSPTTERIEFISPRHCYNDGTSIDWNIAYPIILRECYDRYGDLSLLDDHYETLKRHTDSYIAEAGENNGFVKPCWFGDWFTVDMPEGMEKVAFACGPDGHRQNPPFGGQLFYIRTLRLTAEIAKLLGHEDDVRMYTAAREDAIGKLLAKHYDRETAILGSGGQFLCAFALDEHIVPEEDRARVFDNLLAAFEETDWHSLMGVVGTRIIYDVFLSFDRADLAWKLLTSTGYPSMLNMIANGQTTLTEGLDGSGSGCHCMFASPDTALYKLLGGIRVDRTKEIPVTVAPYFARTLDHVHCTQTLSEGTLTVDWKRTDGELTVVLEIPAELKVMLRLPDAKETVLGGGTYTYTI